MAKAPKVETLTIKNYDIPVVVSKGMVMAVPVGTTDLTPVTASTMEDLANKLLERMACVPELPDPATTVVYRGPCSESWVTGLPSWTWVLYEPSWSPGTRRTASSGLTSVSLART